MSNHNPFNIRDGEVLPVVGGPHHGAERGAAVLFPFIDGGLPAAICRIGQAVYELDQKNRRWVYMKTEALP